MEFVQPVGKPSHMAYWHYFIKLHRITGLVKDHLVSVKPDCIYLLSNIG